MTREKYIDVIHKKRLYLGGDINYFNTKYLLNGKVKTKGA